MDFKVILKNFFTNYVGIYAGSMFGTFVFCSIFQPDVLFGLSYFRDMLLFSLLGDLPLFIFYSRKELSNSELLLRKIIHFCVLEIVLLSFAWYLRLYRNFGQGCFFAVLVLLVYILITIISYKCDSIVAEEMNQKLKELKQKKQS